MPVCRGCGEEADELVVVKVDGKRKKLCEQCAELASENDAVMEESESVVQRMMEFKGRR
jgi:ribosome-binding protein aMBF1 (putative translation factor)